MTKLQINIIKIHQKEFRKHFFPNNSDSFYYNNFRKLKLGQKSRFDNPAVIDWVNKKMEE